MKTSKPTTRNQRSVDAAVAAFTVACADLPLHLDSKGNFDLLDSFDSSDYKLALVSIISAGTSFVTMRAFTVARFWKMRHRYFHGDGRALLRELFPAEWKKREVQFYEWARIAALVPLDDVDYSKSWEYYRRVYGRASGARRPRWQDLRSYRDGDNIVFIESRNGVEEIHSKSISQILALLADENGVVE